MLKRVPTTSDGKVCDSHTESSRVHKPYKPPTLIVERAQPQRKRKRVSYKGQAANDGDDDDDDENGRKKKKNKGEGPSLTERDKDGNYHNEAALLAAVKKYPVYEVKKPFDQVRGRAFSFPQMTNKDGQVVTHIPSNVALGTRPPTRIIPRPLHDPMEGHAIVLYDPTIDDRETDEERKERLKQEAKEKDEEEARQKTAGMFNPHKSLRKMLGETGEKKQSAKVAVVIDPRLTKVLRPHQVEGVKFLYKCTTGMVVDNQYGCIMADEMGLGKTLQCLSLLWTLLKQSPHAGKPAIEKCVIVCPASLVKNWANEFVKWLGPDAINALAMDGKGTKNDQITRVQMWVAARGRNVTQPVMIVSYESLRALTPYINCPIGLMLCDEGHRLKNSESLTWLALNGLDVKRRVILTGTPVQNDLTEYFSLLNFANPGYLGSKNDFRKNFENAIIRGRDSEATDGAKAECEKKLKELGGLVTKFIIRRTNDLLSKYLPVKYEQVVFCRSSDLQVKLYRLFINSPVIKALLRGKDSQPLKAINLLKKLCNHPELLNLPSDLQGCEEFLPEDFPRGELESRSKNGRNQTMRPEWGGKFLVLARFLHHIHTQTNDKIVLISNYTQTLDLFEKLLRSNKYGYFRLDGTMSVSKRQKLVDSFNNPEGKEFVFLLSSKAGGCGINLIGANRLVLFDPDWNPAADQQALARVWRDGQKKECFVYRFIATGTIEENIFQRQASKMALSSAVVDEMEDAERHFSVDALRKLFEFHEDTLCSTHETFKCKRCKNGKQVLKAPAMLYGDASTWNHYTNAELRNNHDDLLRAEVDLDEVSFVFQYISHFV
ncbi:SNF2 family domain-containing protein [Mycena kentingensis (nom. inval.)]|nr:SNF2 family domain-containing protein [Mycena kentingensis (nom. inval.)]